MEIYSKEANYEFGQKWIPVTEGLPDPDEDGLVMVTVSGRYGQYKMEDEVHLADYWGEESEDSGEWTIDGKENEEMWKGKKVTAWMPVPVAYEEA